MLGQHVIQGYHENATGSFTLGLVSYVDYSLPAYSGEGTGQFAMEMEVIGNINTHEFSIRTIRRNLNTAIGNGYAMDMVGKGISKGAENFFLLKAKDNGDVIAPLLNLTSTDPRYRITFTSFPNNQNHI